MTDIDLELVDEGECIGRLRGTIGEIHLRVDVYHHMVAPPATTPSTVIQKPGEAGPNGKEPPAMTDFVLQDDQEVVVTIAPGDVVSNPIPGAVFDAGSVTVTSAVPTVLEVELSDDQTSYTATAVGPEETGVTVTVEGTVDGVACKSTLTFDITASPASTVLQTPGTPTTIPADADGGTTTTGTVADDPASGLPLYAFAGSGTIDTTQWTAVADVTGTDGETLYTFSGDTAGAAPTGASAEWVPFTGTPTPVTPAAPVDTTNPPPPAS